MSNRLTLDFARAKRVFDTADIGRNRHTESLMKIDVAYGVAGLESKVA